MDRPSIFQPESPEDTSATNFKRQCFTLCPDTRHSRVLGGVSCQCGKASSPTWDGERRGAPWPTFLQPRDRPQAGRPEAEVVGPLLAPVLVQGRPPEGCRVTAPAQRRPPAQVIHAAPRRCRHHRRRLVAPPCREVRVRSPIRRPPRDRKQRPLVKARRRGAWRGH